MNQINIIDEDDSSTNHQYSTVMIDASGNVYLRLPYYEAAGIGGSWQDDPVWRAYDVETWKEIFSETTQAIKDAIKRCCDVDIDRGVDASTISAYVAYAGCDAYMNPPLCSMRDFLKMEGVGLAADPVTGGMEA